MLSAHISLWENFPGSVSPYTAVLMTRSFPGMHPMRGGGLAMLCILDSNLLFSSEHPVNQAWFSDSKSNQNSGVLCWLAFCLLLSSPTNMKQRRK